MNISVQNTNQNQGDPSQLQQSFNQNQNQEGGENPETLLRQSWDIINKRTQQLQICEEKLIQKDKQIDSLRRELQQQAEYNEQVQLELRVKTENRKLFDHLNANCVDLKSQLNKQTIEKDDTINSLRGEVKRLNQEIIFFKSRDFQMEKYKRGIEMQDAEKKKYSDQIRDRDVEIEQLNKRLIKGDDRQYDEYVTRIKTLDQKIDSLQLLISQKDKQIYDGQIRIQELIEMNKVEAHQIEQRCTAQIKQNYEIMLREKVQSFDKEMIKKQEEVMRLNNEVILQNNKVQLLEHHSSKMSDIKNNNKEVFALEDRLNKIKVENEELQSIKIHFTEEVQNVRKIESSRYEQQIYQLQSQLESQRSQVSQQTRDIEAFYSEIQARDAKIKALEQEIIKIRQIESTQRNRDAEIEGLRATVQVLKKENEKLYPTVSQTNYTYEIINNVDPNKSLQIQNTNLNASNNPNANAQRMSVRSNGSMNGSNNYPPQSANFGFSSNTNNNNNSNNYNQQSYVRGSLQPNYLQGSTQIVNQQQRQTYQ